MSDAAHDSDDRPDDRPDDRSADLDDVPGTTVFTAERARQGYALNQFCMSLMDAGNRARFTADEAAYLDEWPLTPAQRSAVERRDLNAAIAEGGNIYFLAKIVFTDGNSMQHGCATMTGMTQEEYAAMMLAGGRKPEGWRSIKDGS
jgi:protocatechuate 4,5-dioxygenase alpha chain